MSKMRERIAKTIRRKSFKSWLWQGIYCIGTAAASAAVMYALLPLWLALTVAAVVVAPDYLRNEVYIGKERRSKNHGQIGHVEQLDRITTPITSIASVRNWQFNTHSFHVDDDQKDSYRCE